MKNDKRIKTRCAFSMWIKTVACVLSILIMLYAVPANVFAELIDAINRRGFTHILDAQNAAK